MLSFLGLAGFFLPVTALYALWSDFEPVGTTALLLLVAMWGMVGFFLTLQSRKVDPTPEDDPSARIEDHPTSDYGFFAPFSCWRFVRGVAVTLVLLGLTRGCWISRCGVSMPGIGVMSI